MWSRVAKRIAPGIRNPLSALDPYRVSTPCGHFLSLHSERCLTRSCGVPPARLTRLAVAPQHRSGKHISTKPAAGQVFVSYVLSTGIEPVSPPSEGGILSIERRERH